MTPPWKTAVWTQFDGAITTLRNAIEDCPDELWEAPCGSAPVWRAFFHALFFLDLYAGETAEDFRPPEPFGLTELEDGGIPPRVYTRDELLRYLEHGRSRVRSQVEGLGEDAGATPSGIEWLGRRGMSRLEAVLYNLRHVQHHAAQVNLVLRQCADHAAPWVFRGA